MIVELISFSIGALNGFAIASLILTLIDRKLQKQKQNKKPKKEKLNSEWSLIIGP